MPRVFDESLKAVSNEALLERITSGNPTMIKEAESSVDAFIRMQVQEEGFLGNFITRLPLENSDLTIEPEHDKPVRIEELEPDAPGAVSVSFDTLPDNHYFHGRFAKMFFDRVQSPRFQKDVDTLRVYRGDIRQMLSDGALKDMSYVEDYNFIRAMDLRLGTPNVVNATTGVVQWVAWDNPITKETLAEVCKIMGRTPNRIPATRALVNNVTIWDVVKASHEEIGSGVEELWVNGFTQEKLLGLRWYVTTKRDLVPDGTIYLFGDEKFMGKFYSLQEPTMVIKNDGPMISWWLWETIGLLLANVASFGRADFYGNRTQLVEHSFA